MEDKDIIASLLEQNAKLTEQLIELARMVVEAPPQPVYAPVMETRKYPLFVPESEEDAREAYANGDIDATQLEDVLREIEFFNTEITVPSGS